MSVIENSKLTVVGAGAVGSSVAYASLIRGSARHVALYDIATEKTEAEVLDLSHGAQFTGSSDITGGSDISVAAGSHVIVITAGAKQKPGQTRTELAGVNANILKTMMPRLLDVAPDAVFVIVTNPCDVLTVLAQEATDLPVERIFASGTVLDTSRLRVKIAQRAGVSVASVHAYIVGEHGDTEFPLWSHATIGTVPILDWQPLDGQPKFTVDELDQIAVDVRDAAYKVIQGKGATNYAIGLSSARIVEAVLGDQNAVLPVSTVLDDFHGVSGVALSVPSIVNAKGAAPIRETTFSANELGLFRRSADALREVAVSLR
ncbi:L-lactate dehydrogenase [Microbacterium telephonicum]|uniref:L-lactate dehydrogenase n=1 Tax=Microbacterium telephonicum TaxID=1714841 RepID=A0A498C0X3_9MICO|nr:L-lactate dehydrogenase [Microbacterium telephonicum]RLK46740.1 malate dehydrogenase (NAD) [Microbacterium telephonicum]